MSDTTPRPAFLRLLPYLLLAAILALAAAVRFYRLGAVSFTFDAAAVSNLAAQWIDQGRLPLQGMVSSTGFRNPPLTVYLISLPLRVSRDPLALTGFVVALNLLAVLGAFWLGRRYWSMAAGLLAALLFAVSPWAVQHSRGVLGQDLLAPGVVALMLCTLAWFVDGRRWMLAASLAILAALIQIHLAAIALAPLLALLLLWELISQRRQGVWSRFWQPLALGLALGALLYLPYLIADAQQGWINVRGFLGQGGSAAGVQGQALDLALINIGGRNIHALAGPQRFRDFLAGLPGIAYWPDRLEELLVLAAALFLGARLLRRRYDARQARSNSVLLLWLAVPALFFLLFNAQVQLHYLVVLYPAPYLALGAAAVELHSLLAGRVWLRRGLTAAGGLALLLLVVWQITLIGAIYRFIDQHDTPDGWPTPARIVRAAAHTLHAYASRNPDGEVIVLCQGQVPEWDECPAVWTFSHQPVAQCPGDGLRRPRLSRLSGGRGRALSADAGRQPGRG
jgi:4-amino-4-deoxy-L-arabinose transferase-like glycosyltransferase